MPVSGLPIRTLTISNSFLSRHHLLETMEQKSHTSESDLLLSSCQTKSSLVYMQNSGAYLLSWWGGLLESITRLWLTQRGTVHPLNAPSATTVGPKAPGCQPASTHA